MRLGEITLLFKIAHYVAYGCGTKLQGSALGDIAGAHRFAGLYILFNDYP